MSDKKPIVKFVKGNTIMSMDTKDYYLFDKSEEYFSMTPFNREDCIDGETIISVSPQSPLGNHLLGKEVGYSFTIHATHYEVEKLE
jgi:hypothetical protein